MDRALKRNKEDFWYLTALLLISIVIVLPFMHYGKIYANSDWSFHAQRVEQIYRNLQVGKAFTFIATSTFNHTGVGSFLFYPTLFLYPWALLRFVINPVAAFYVWYSMITLIAFVVAFYSMQKYAKSTKTAFVFSLIYVLNPYRLYLGHAVFGEFIAVSFLPLVFLGFYQLFFVKEDKHAWVTLAIGMALVTYSHILSMVLITEICFVILVGACILGHYRQIFAKWQPLLKCVGLWALLSAPIIYLFGYSYIGRGVSFAVFGVPMMLVPSLSTVIKNSLMGIDSWGIGIILILTVMLGWYQGLRSHIDMWTYILGVALLVMATRAFPWAQLSQSPIAVIQLPYRYLSYAGLFLGVVAAKLIIRIVDHIKISRRSFVIIGTILAIIGYGYAEKAYLQPARSTPPTNLSNQLILQPLPDSWLDNHNYGQQFNYQVLYGETDYYPNESLRDKESIINQQASINGHQLTIKSVGEANRIVTNVKTSRAGNLDLPIVMYHGTSVMLNGHRVMVKQSERGTVSVRLPRAGKYRIVVSYNPGNPGFGFYIAVIISIMSIFILTWKRTLIGQKGAIRN